MGVPRRPSRSGSSPISSRIWRTACSTTSCAMLACPPVDWPSPGSRQRSRRSHPRRSRARSRRRAVERDRARFAVHRGPIADTRVPSGLATIDRRERPRATLSLQERYGPHTICFGCGPANAAACTSAAFPTRVDDDVVADWKPEPHHQAFPSVLNGGIIGTLHGLPLQLDRGVPPDATAAAPTSHRRPSRPTTTSGCSSRRRPTAPSDCGRTSSSRPTIGRRSSASSRPAASSPPPAAARSWRSGPATRPTTAGETRSSVDRAARRDSSSGAVAHQVVAGAR